MIGEKGEKESQWRNLIWQSEVEELDLIISGVWTWEKRPYFLI